MTYRLSSRIFAIFLAGWVLVELLLLPVTFGFLRWTAAEYERDIFEPVASRFAEQLIRNGTDEAALERTFAEFEALNTNLVPYLLSREGRVLFALDPKSLGASVPVERIRTTPEQWPVPWTPCGVDPTGESGCINSFAKSIELHGEQQFVYLASTHGLVQEISTLSGWWRALPFLLPGLLLAFVAVTLIASLLSRYLTREFSAVQEALNRYAAGDFHYRYQPPLRDELSEVTFAVQSLARTVEERQIQVQSLLGRRATLLRAFVHDFRRPLQQMRLSIERARSVLAPLPADTKKLALQLNQSLWSQELLLNSLPEAGAESDQQSRGAAWLSVTTMLQSAMQQLQLLTEQRRITIHAALAADLPPVYGPHEQFYRIFLNLLDNALRYTPEDGTVTIRSTISAGLVVVDIEDSGIGIHPEEREHIFEPSFRSERGKTINPHGTGLGLSIVQSLVHAVGGAIEVHSPALSGTALPDSPSLGSTFRTIFPTAQNSIVPADPVRVAKPERTRAAAVETGGSLGGHANQSFEIAAALCLIPLFALCIQPPLRLADIAPLAALLLALLGAMSFAGRFAPGSRGAALVRAALIVGFGLTLHFLSSFLDQAGAIRALLSLAAMRGLLFGMGLFYRPLFSETIPIILSIGIPALITFVSRHLLTLQITSVLCCIGGILIAFQLYGRRPRSLFLRTAVVLTLTYFGTLVGQAISIGGDIAQVMFRDGVPYETEKVAALISAVSPLRTSEHLALDINSLNPRVTACLLDNSGQLRTVGFGTVCSDFVNFLPAPMSTEIPLNTVIKAGSAKNRGSFAVFSLPSSAGERLVVFSESGLSRLALRRSGEFIVSIALIFTFFAVVPLSTLTAAITFRRLQLRGALIANGLKRFRAAEVAFPEPKEVQDELDRLQLGIAALCRYIHHLLEQLRESENRTLTIMTSMREALEPSRSVFQRLASRDQLGAQDLRVMEDHLLLQSEIVEDVSSFVACEVEKSPTSSTRTPLRSLLEDALLELHPPLRNGALPPYELIIDDSLAVPGDEAMLVRALRYALREHLRSPSFEAIASVNGHDVQVIIQGESPHPSPERDPFARFGRVITEQLLKIHNAAVRYDSHRTVITFSEPAVRLELPEHPSQI